MPELGARVGQPTLREICVVRAVPRIKSSRSKQGVGSGYAVPSVQKLTIAKMALFAPKFHKFSGDC